MRIGSSMSAISGSAQLRVVGGRRAGGCCSGAQAMATWAEFVEGWSVPEHAL
jgi:hypothetical protein